MSSKRTGPPGIVTRAVATDAYRSASVVASTASQASKALSEIPDAHKQAAATIEELIRRQARVGGAIHPSNVDALEQAKATVREALAQTVQELERDSELIDMSLAADPIYQGRVDAQSRQGQFRTAYAVRQRANYYWRLLQAASAADRGWSGTPPIDPVTGDPIGPGAQPGPGVPGAPKSPDQPQTPPSVTPGRTLAPRRPRMPQKTLVDHSERALARAWSRVRRSSRLGLGVLGGGAILRIVHRSTGTATEYETRIGRLQAQRGAFSWGRDWIHPKMPQVLAEWGVKGPYDPDDPRFKSDSERVEKGARPIRKVMEEFSSMFLLQGRDALSTMEQLSFNMTPARALASGQLSRRLGLGKGGSGRVGKAYHQMLMRTGGELTLRVVGKRGRTPGLPVQGNTTEAGTASFRTWMPTSIHDRDIVESDAALGMLTNIGAALAPAGMGTRGEEFLGDVVQRTTDFSAGVGYVDPAIPLGYSVALGRSGFGGTSWRSTGSHLASGIASVTITASTGAVSRWRALMPSALWACCQL